MSRRVCACLLWVLGLTAVALAACSSPDPKLYTIAPATGPTKGGGPRIIVLERVEIASYLQRSQIVRSSEEYRLDLKSNDWWGDALGAMLRRVLREELSQRLPQSVVLSETGAITASADATIDLDFQRIDEDHSGHLVLAAQVSVSFKGQKAPVLRSFRFEVPPPTPDVTGEVTAISTAVGQLADGLAATLASAPAQR
jgi:uncharacterized lipoprotein YmbA